MTDSRREYWLEQYEEAALGLLMEDYAEKEGACLLQEFENSQQQATVASMPESLDAKCQKLISKAYREYRCRNAASRIVKAVGKAVVVMLVFFGLTAATVMSVDAWRIPVLNFILSHSGRSATVDFTDSPKKAKNLFEEKFNLVSSIIPDGYELQSQPSFDDVMIEMRWMNANGNWIIASIQPSSGTFLLDTENAKCTEMTVHGHPAVLIEKKGWFLIWNDELEGFAYTVFANGLNETDFWTLVYTLMQ